MKSYPCRFGVLIWALTLGLGFALASSAAEVAKKLLVVTVTTGFRHGSIPVGEEVIAKLAAESGEFSVDFVREPSPRPAPPREPKRAAAESDDSFAAKTAKFQVEQADWKTRDAVWLEQTRRLLAERMSLAALAKYDGVIFANTTGDLPLPDREGFLSWIRSGKAFIGMHAATDTFLNYPPYLEMIGGAFISHPWHQPVTIRVEDAKHPATAPYGATFEVAEEIYQFKRWERNQLHVLMSLDPANEERPKQVVKPGEPALGFFERGVRPDRDYAVAWTKEYGAGRVFYTSLGHEEAVWRDEKYQRHLLGGIRWALGLAPAASK